MKNPTLQELMEYVDGTLEPLRADAVKQMIAQSKHLQHELALLKAMEETVRRTRIAPSKNFTRNVMNEIRPSQESFWYRLAKNSSNVFAMVIVLSLISIVLFSSTGTERGTAGQLNSAYTTMTSSYHSLYEELTTLIGQYSKPLDSAVKTTSGRMLFIGLFIFALYIIVDEVFVKRMVLRK
jgi:hypothetical protein